MTSNAQARLTAANHVLTAWESGEFQEITAAAARREGYEIEADATRAYEWPDGIALQNPTEPEWIEVHIPNGNDIAGFNLNLATGEIQTF